MSRTLFLLYAHCLRHYSLNIRFAALLLPENKGENYPIRVNACTQNIMSSIS